MAVITTPELATAPNEPQECGVLSSFLNMGVAVPYDLQTVLAVPAFFDLIVIGTPEGGMYAWQRSIVDGVGDVIPSARVEVRRAEDNILASLFEDLAGATPLSNPFLADSEGFARFYAPAGAYTITASSSGLNRTWENVLLGVRFVDMPAELGPYILSTVLPLINQQIADALDLFLEENPGGTGGYVTASTVGSALPVGWSVAHTATAHYRLTTPTPPAGKRWVVTANVIANDDRYANIAEGVLPNQITVAIVDTGSGGVDDDFLFVAQLVRADQLQRLTDRALHPLR